jgi:CRP-like cAMP-binding protein
MELINSLMVKISQSMMSKKAKRAGRRKHLVTERLKALAASSLAQKVGYLRADDFPSSTFLDSLPTQSFSPNRIIRCKDKLYLVRRGLVEIWHTQHDYLVKKLTIGTFFGNMPSLGQTMLVTRAISGNAGATVAVMDADSARDWLESDSIRIVKKLGPKLAHADEEHYRALFQTADSRLAALLLELAGEGTAIEGQTQCELGETLGSYRETVANMLNAMKQDKLIDIGRMRITILDKRGLRELSEK